MKTLFHKVIYYAKLAGFVVIYASIFAALFFAGRKSVFDATINVAQKVVAISILAIVAIFLLCVIPDAFISVRDDARWWYKYHTKRH